jgi:glycosyltransferase involved in cell wall biosynthesis
MTPAPGPVNLEPMRICFIGKYPPIQGGVSAQTYWAVRGLAERGHEVCVVTNAHEVEDLYRVRLEPDDRTHLEPDFPATGGRVRVFRPERFGRRLGHIPAANPFVSKLAGMATKVVRGLDCDVIVGSYYEPYGMAAHLVGSWTDVPVLLQHAGSDLDRLMLVPEVAAAYQEILRAADGVITRPTLVGRMLGMGVARTAIRLGPPYGVPAVFTPDAKPFAPEDIERLAATMTDTPRPATAFDPELPTIGMYGKPGEFKGTFDLISALGLLAEAGPRFNVLLMAGHSQRDRVVSAITAAGLDDRTWVLPFVPHWRVPGFVRACTAVCFLERDFPVVIHHPVVPREVMACGTCLVLSGEIHDKQGYRDRLIDGENVVLVRDPKDRPALAERLRTLVERPAAAAEIGARGHLVALDFTDVGGYIDAWEDLLNSVLDRAPAAAATEIRPLGERRDQALAWARKLLDDFDGAVARLAGRAVVGSAADGDDRALAEEFCRRLTDHADARVRAAARYQRVRLWVLGDEPPHAPAVPVPNTLGGREPTADAMRPRYPFRCAPARVERFDHDVTPLFCHGASEATGPIVVCFARLANLAPTELRANEATAELLERCDGSRSTAQLVAEIVTELGTGAEEAATLTAQIHMVLRRLYNAGVVAFADGPTTSAALSTGR